MLPIATASEWLLYHANWVIVAIIAIALLAVGMTDLLRFSITRIWAISSVCFSESVRRKVLWITPLAIVGVMIVAQLQRPSDEQDAIRQITKFFLFATGLVVVLVAILLACTSLPKEIDNRVIFTIVTKPTTRLEIVFGKTVGFARVTALILIIMGAFTSAYLEFRSWRLEKDIAARLDQGLVDPQLRPALEHYRAAGLLTSKVYAATRDLQFYSQLPELKSPERYAGGGVTSSVVIPFDITPAMFDATKDADLGFGVLISGSVKLERSAGAKPWVAPSTEPSTQPMKISGPLPLLSSTQPTGAPPAGASVPTISVTIMQEDFTYLADDSSMGSGHVVTLKPSGSTDFTLALAPAAIERLMDYVRGTSGRRIYVSFSTGDPAWQYIFDDRAATMGIVTQTADKEIRRKTILPPPDPNRPGQPMAPIFRGGYSRYGEQMAGSTKPGPCAVYHFANDIPADTTGNIDFEMKMGVDRNGDDTDEASSATNVQFQVRDESGALSEPVNLQPETNRTFFFTFPASFVKSGNFDLIVRCSTPTHDIAMQPGGCLMVIREGSFYVNLFKSLFIFWLMTVLVVAVSIFCSVFVSWPIAVVLCIVILLGRWGVNQLGDSTHAGIGAAVATDFGFRDEKQVRVVSESVETLTKFLNVLSTVLPDIDAFPATEDIERGVSISGDKLLQAMEESLSFALPLLALGYIRLKFKEVAP